MPINADAKVFLEELTIQSDAIELPNWGEWRKWCQERKIKYPAVLPENRLSPNLVDPYYFVETLTELLPTEAIAIAGNGTACVVLFQAGKVKTNQRIF